jgi:hypothetical protein
LELSVICIHDGSVRAVHLIIINLCCFEVWFDLDSSLVLLAINRKVVSLQYYVDAWWLPHCYIIRVRSVDNRRIDP